MTSCVTRRQAILTAFTNRWLWSAGRRPTPPLSSFSRQHPILTTPTSRSYSSLRVRNTPFLGFLIVREMVLVIERFGIPRKILSERGPHFVVPFLDRVAFEHYTGDRIVELQLSALTKDGFRFLFDVEVWVKTVDVVLASYNVPYADHIAATKTIATIALQRRVSMLTVEQLISERVALVNAILLDITPVMETWGIECQKYLISLISYDHLVTETKSFWGRLCGYALQPQLRDLAGTRDEST